MIYKYSEEFHWLMGLRLVLEYSYSLFCVGNMIELCLNWSLYTDISRYILYYLESALEPSRRKIGQAFFTIRCCLTMQRIFYRIILFFGFSVLGLWNLLLPYWSILLTVNQLTALWNRKLCQSSQSELPIQYRPCSRRIIIMIFMNNKLCDQWPSYLAHFRIRPRKSIDIA